MAGYFIDVIAGPDAGQSLVISPGQTRVIGRSRACDLAIDDDLISAQHLIVSCDAGVHVQDLRTTNGTSLYDQTGEIRQLRGSGRAWPDAGLVKIGTHLLQLRPAQVTPARVVPVPQTASGGPPLRTVQLSPPATTPPLPPPLDAPPKEPDPPDKRRVPWVSMATSALGGLVMAALFKMAFLLIFSILAPVGMLAQFGWEKRRAQKEYAAALHEHAVAAAAHKAEQSARDLEVARLDRLIAQDPAQVRRAVAVPTVELWQETNRPAAECELLLGFIVDAGAHLPIHVPLGRGAVGIIGPPRQVAALTRWLAIQVATAFAPGVAQVLAPWSWAGALPHSANREQVFEFRAATSSSRLPRQEPGFEIVFGTTRSELPAHCKQVLEVHADFSGRYEYLDDNTVTKISRICGLSEAGAKQAAADLTSLRDPASVPQVFRTLEEIWESPTETSVISHWKSAAHTPGRLPARLGEQSNGEVLELDLTREGPHLLIGGTTGSGKSVLQRAFIMSLALAQRPEHLALVLIDYKGGAAFRCLEALPHVIDIVTDLDASATVRTLQSLRAELRRREVLLAEHGFSDHDQLAAAGLISEAPRLVIVIDELRALHDQHPELLEELVQLAALGRSLGMHLVLATQRPGSVVNADMRANINARIALRVQSAADSQDILEVSGAADLPIDQPGAALLRLGSAPPQRLQVAAISDEQAQKMAALIAGAAAKISAQPPRRPWLRPLPRVLEVLGAAGESGGPEFAVAGLRDHPQNMRQDALHIPVGDGHLLIAGGSGSGRTSALRALARNSPAPVHIIARNPALIADEHAPWIGTHAGIEDRRLIARLIAHLERQDPHPRLLLIDDADWLLDPENQTSQIWQLINDLLRRGGEKRISIVLAGGRLLLAPRVGELVATRWILNWADDTALATGTVPRDITVPVGAGGVLELGAAPVSGRVLWVPPPEPGTWKSRACRALPAPPPPRLRPLPALVEARDLAPLVSLSATRSQDVGSVQIPLGTGGDYGETIAISPQPIAIAGPPGSGRTNALNIIVDQCAMQGHSVLLITVDPAHRSAAIPTENIVVADPESAQKHLRTEELTNTIVAIDDLDLALSWDPRAPWLEALRERIRAGRPVIATATTAAWSGSYSNIMSELRRPRTGIVLHPGTRGSNDVFGVDVTREADAGTPPPGRAVVVLAGAVKALQLARNAPLCVPKPGG